MLARKTDPKARGFTLIELLVVVSIIALLVSLLMPALNRARDHAKKSVCLSNQHQIMVGVHMYAAGFEDQIPPTDDDLNLLWCYSAYRTENPETWVGVGRLYDTNLIDDPEVFYCPAQLNPQFRYMESGYSDWDNPVAVGRHSHFTSYYYGYPGQINIISEQQREAVKLSTFGRDALIADIFVNLRTTDYPQDTWAHRHGLNVGFGDGSSEFVPLSQEIINHALSAGGAGGSLHCSDAYIWSFFQWLSGKPRLIEEGACWPVPWPE